MTLEFSGVSSMKNLIAKIKSRFVDLPTSLRTVIWTLIPVMVTLSILSDRSPYNYFNFAIYGVLSALILFYIFKYKKFVFDIYTALIILFNICILVTQIINFRILEFPRTIILLSLFSIVFYQFIITTENKDKVYFAILVGGLLFALYFVLYYRGALLNVNFSDRLGEEFSDQNDLAKYLAIFSIISLVFFFKTKSYLKILSLGSVAIFIGLLLLTGSVSNFLCTAILVLAISLVMTKRKNKLYVLIGAIALVVLVVLLFQLPFMSYYKTRVEAIFNTFFHPDEKKDGSAVDRFALFQEGLRLFLSRPVFGYGYDQVQYYTHGYGPFSHNNFIELLACFGIFGFLTYEALLLLPIYKMFISNKYRKQELFTLIYLFIFQTFLVIYRKKIEFLLMPLAFSSCCFSYYPAFTVKFDKFRPTFSKEAPKMMEADKEIVANKNKNLLVVYNAQEFSEDRFNYVTNFAKTFSKEYNVLFVVLCEEISEKILHRLNNLKLQHKIIRSKSSSLSLLNEMMDLVDDFKPRNIYCEADSIKIVSNATIGVASLSIISTIKKTDENASELLTKYSSSKKHKLFVSEKVKLPEFKKKEYRPRIIKEKDIESMTSKRYLNSVGEIFKTTYQKGFLSISIKGKND